MNIPSSNLPLISNHCNFKLRNYLKEWESADIETFVRESVSVGTNIPEQEVIREYISSCSKEELSDLEEISYCVNTIESNAYKKAIADVVIEKHLTNIKQEQYQRLFTYYKELCKLKNEQDKGEE